MRVPSNEPEGKELNTTSLQEQLQKSLRAQQVAQATIGAGVSYKSVGQQRKVAANNPISTVLAGAQAYRGQSGLPPYPSFLGPNFQLRLTAAGGSSSQLGKDVREEARNAVRAHISELPSKKRNPGPNALDIRQDPKRPKTSDGKPKIDQQKVKFRDKLFKVVRIFFSMADKAENYLTKEMISKNFKLRDNINIITGKNDKEIGNISTDEMALAFKEFQECYTNVKRHLLANDDINSNESLKTSLVNKTCAKIDADISTMLEHGIIKYQELKQNFQSKVERYNSLGITLPDQEVEEINRYEYTSGANLERFETLVKNAINKLKDQYVEKIQEIKQNFKSEIERYNSLGITLPDQEVEEINSDEGNLGTNLERFETLVKNAINKLKDQYVEKVKAKLFSDVDEYLKQDIVLKELEDKLDRARVKSLEETNKVIQECKEYIQDSYKTSKVIVEESECDKKFLEGFAEINKQIIGNQIFDDYHWT
jgi:predicted Zn-dependent protease with MMP-like domain